MLFRLKWKNLLNIPEPLWNSNKNITLNQRTTRRTTQAPAPPASSGSDEDCTYDCKVSGGTFCKVRFNAPFGFRGSIEGFCFNNAEKQCFSTPDACEDCKFRCEGGLSSGNFKLAVSLGKILLKKLD